ncbi:hypothetical protein LJR231_005457 [Phyllobacterium sp. LjRoot231]|uniref:hypothetical protein n=1 Tax=Phyllobacterium sp. LjRoot231 TaxID=3342289 RepID=UPI003ECE81C2
MLQNPRPVKPLGRLLLIDYAGDLDLSAVRIAASIFIVCASHCRRQAVEEIGPLNRLTLHFLEGRKCANVGRNLCSHYANEGRQFRQTLDDSVRVCGQAPKPLIVAIAPCDLESEMRRANGIPGIR